ncbi:MAG: hypothetical protein ACI8ZM_002428 [Crocinitomix sp.]|jgi:hypothetical protein
MAIEAFEPVVTAAAFKKAYYAYEELEGNPFALSNLARIDIDFKNCTNDAFYEKFIELCRKNKITYRGFKFKNEVDEYRYKVVVYKDGYDSHNREYSDPKKNISRELALLFKDLLDVQLGNKKVIEDTKKDRI